LEKTLQIKEVVYGLLGVDAGEGKGLVGELERVGWVEGGSIKTPPTKNFAAEFT
jgi:hypothetical protein